MEFRKKNVITCEFLQLIYWQIEEWQLFWSEPFEMANVTAAINSNDVSILHNIFDSIFELEYSWEWD